MPEGLTFAIAAVLAISAPLSGWIAFRRDRPPVPWFVFGALSGPLAIGLLLVAPPGACPRCDTIVRGWPASCATCGRRFAVGLPIARPAEPGPASGVGSSPTPERAAPAPDAQGSSRSGASRRRRAEPWAIDLPADPWTAERSPDPSPEPKRDPVVTPFPRPAALPREAPAAPSGLWPRLVAQATPSEPATSSAGPDHQAGGSSDAIDGGLHMIASGIFTGGSARLEIGSRYGIGRDGADLVVLGPVDRTPNQVQAVHPLDEIDLLSIEDRITVARSGGQDRLVMAFISAAGLRGKDLEAALADVARDVAAHRAAAPEDIADIAGPHRR